MNRGFHAARLAIAASLRGPAPLSGQDATRKITGTVTDPSGSAVPRAKITVLDTNTNIAKNVTTDKNGVYRALSLASGH
jgi:hypothetical protein